MREKPIFLGTPTYKDFQDWYDASLYCKGWNDAMHEIFDSNEEKLKKMREREIKELKEKFTIYQGGKE